MLACTKPYAILQGLAPPLTGRSAPHSWTHYARPRRPPSRARRLLAAAPLPRGAPVGGPRAGAGAPRRRSCAAVGAGPRLRVVGPRAVVLLGAVGVLLWAALGVRAARVTRPRVGLRAGPLRHRVRAVGGARVRPRLVRGGGAADGRGAHGGADGRARGGHPEGLHADALPGHHLLPAGLQDALDALAVGHDDEPHAPGTDPRPGHRLLAAVQLGRDLRVGDQHPLDATEVPVVRR
mmetsp:Transcript_9056/g.24163  ORF Transcript_9056/g.24163 Transcript_9056/m.24163 type:complete len:236 (+) Transcript_9056:359-1066(+)